MSANVRADKWLWATRFFKTRSAAAETCESGRVKRGGHLVKPATSLHVGDVLELPFYEGPGTRTIRIAGLIDQRVGAPEAQACYVELTAPETTEANQAAVQEKRARRAEGELGRPTKRDRREIDRFRDLLE